MIECFPSPLLCLIGLYLDCSLTGFWVFAVGVFFLFCFVSQENTVYIGSKTPTDLQIVVKSECFDTHLIDNLKTVLSCETLYFVVSSVKCAGKTVLSDAFFHSLCFIK